MSLGISESTNGTCPFRTSHEVMFIARRRSLCRGVRKGNKAAENSAGTYAYATAEGPGQCGIDEKNKYGRDTLLWDRSVFQALQWGHR